MRGVSKGERYYEGTEVHDCVERTLGTGENDFDEPRPQTSSHKTGLDRASQPGGWRGTGVR